MALVSLSKKLWDPYSVLALDPNDPSFTCVGIAKTTGSRCRWPYESEQLRTYQRTAAVKHLESMSEIHPSAITPAALSLLAKNTLCRDYHQGQAGAKVTEWKAKIENHLREHSERLAMASAVRQLQCELDDAKKLQSGIAKEKDASRQEVEATRQAWESATAELKALDRRHTEEVERLKKQMEGGKAMFEKDMAATAQEMRGLKESKAWLDVVVEANIRELVGLKANVRSRDETLDERARRSEEDVEDLRRQLAASGDEVAILKEARASSEEREKLSQREAESLRQEIRESNARLEASDVNSSEGSKRLGEQFEVLEQKQAESENQIAAQVSQLREQDRKIEQFGEQMDMVRGELAERDRHIEQLAKQMEGLEKESMERDQHIGQLAKQMDVVKEGLTERDRQVGQFVKQMNMVNQKLAQRDRQVEQLVKQMDTMKQELAEREVSGPVKVKIGGRKQLIYQQDKMASPQPQNVKKGLFAVISRQPPRILVKKISKIMRTESTPYVQSVV